MKNLLIILFVLLVLNVNSQTVITDTLTITDGSVWLIDVQGKPFNYYRVVGGGTASDTTLITIKWNK